MGEAEEIAERLRIAVGGHPISSPEGIFNATISLGVASAEPGTEWTRESLIRAADEALYRAKNRGRNRVECAELVLSSKVSLGQAAIGECGAEVTVTQDSIRGPVSESLLSPE